jgi:hypothetical protein
MVTFGLAQSVLVDAGSLQVREASREVVPSGFQPLDSLLPAGGIRRGSLIEWLAGGDAAGGAATLAAALACRLARADRRSERGDIRPRTILVVDRSGWFHPPAVLPWLGRDVGGPQLVVARPARDEDEIWAIDQALRCSGVAAVLAWPRIEAGSGAPWPAVPRRSPPHARQQWAIAMRRWQLAARSSGAVGLFVRSAVACREPSWAEARIAVAPLAGGTLLERRLRLERVGGAWPGAACARPGAAGDRTVEIVLDLERGGAAVDRAVDRAVGRAARCADDGRDAPARTAGPNSLTVPAPGFPERGASCRAS